MESRQAAKLKPIGEDRSEETKLRQIPLWVRHIGLYIARTDTKLASFGKAEDLSLGFTIEDPETGAMPVAKRANIDGGSARLRQRME